MIFDKSGLLGHDTVSFDEFETSQWNVLPLFARIKQPFLECLTLEDEDTTFVRNVEDHLPNDTSSHLRKSGVRIPVGARDISTLHIVQTGSGPSSASCLMGTGVLYRG